MGRPRRVNQKKKVVVEIFHKNERPKRNLNKPMAPPPPVPANEHQSNTTCGRYNLRNRIVYPTSTGDHQGSHSQQYSNEKARRIPEAKANDTQSTGATGAAIRKSERIAKRKSRSEAAISTQMRQPPELSHPIPKTKPNFLPHGSQKPKSIPSPLVRPAKSRATMDASDSESEQLPSFIRLLHRYSAKKSQQQSVSVEPEVQLIPNPWQWLTMTRPPETRAHGDGQPTPFSPARRQRQAVTKSKTKRRENLKQNEINNFFEIANVAEKLKQLMLNCPKSYPELLYTPRQHLNQIVKIGEAWLETKLANPSHQELLRQAFPPKSDDSDEDELIDVEN